MPDRVLFPESGFTKADAIDYYRRVARFLLPHLKNRPVSFKRFPGEIGGLSFWEKDAPAFTPSWVKRFPVPRRSGESDIEYILVNDLRTLVWVAEVGGIEIHPFLHRVPRVDESTHVVFDLDPGAGASIVECCEVAVLLRDALEGIRLRSFVKVSGSKGLQVVVPLNSGAAHTVTEAFALLIAEELARANPRLIVAKMTKAVRTKKVFIDWSQNAGYKTTVAVYSLRAKSERPYVSMPVTWKEVKRADPERLYFEPREALKRLTRSGDLWRASLAMNQKLVRVGASGTGASVPVAGYPSPVAIPVDGIRLPRPGSQSGRQLFVLIKGDKGNELWLDMAGTFRRWILREDREGGRRLIAMPAGRFKVDEAFYRGEVPSRWRTRVKIEDIGAYEIIEGSDEQHRFDIWFTGKTLGGEWTLEKIQQESEHRSWQLRPV
ncbi:MAG: hypothetical protein NVSMB68_02970 [Thermoanaerobaculia bacterium]